MTNIFDFKIFVIENVKNMNNNEMKILVLCTSNSCRSQMAEGLFRKYLQNRGLTDAAVAIRSAGLEPGRVNPHAIQVMAEIGIDISDQTSKHLARLINEEFDYIITVCDNAAEKCPVFPGGGLRFHWPFDDPAKASGSEEEILNDFRRVRDEIAEKISHWLSLAPETYR